MIMVELTVNYAIKHIKPRQTLSERKNGLNE